MKKHKLLVKLNMMNFKDKKLIIFDFDGTLINSIPDIVLAINKMLSHYNLPALTIAEVSPFVGNGAEKLVKRAFEYAMSGQQVSNELLAEAFDIYFAAYRGAVCEETYTYPGVMETLDYLHKNAYKMVICSNKPVEFIEPILDKLSIKQFFSYWIGEDSLAEKKPNAAPLLLLANKMNTSVEKCIMVGDSRNDILAAQNARMQSIGLTYGYNYNEHIADYNPTLVVDNFADLQKLF